MDPPKVQVAQKKEEQTNEKTEEHASKHEKEDKLYIKSKKKWKQFNMDENIIEALRQQNKNKPTRVQEEALQVALDPNRKKFNLLLRAINGSGKTLAFLLPIICSLQPGLKTAEDKNVRGKVMSNEIFRPQAVIIIQNFLLQSQLNQYLNYFKDFGENNNVDKLKFKIGVLNQEGHEFGDIIVCMVKSFLNRHSRGNMKLDQCKFVAIDQIDDIYNFDKESLEQLLKIVKSQRPNIIACSATMEKHFLKFYEEIDPDYIRLNINADLQKQTGQKITLEGVKNFSHAIECKKDSKIEIYDYILKVVFKELYGGKEVHKKPQVFVFFNSVDDIYEFDKKFQALSTDFTTQQSQYLKDISRAAIAAKVYKDGKKVDLPHNQKQQIILKFKHSETNVLLCTNIMARGIDIRNATFVINVSAPKKSDRQNDIDVDIYLHRVGRTGRHNDKGVALTLSTADQIAKLTDSVMKVHKIQLVNIDNMKEVVSQVIKCIESNA